MNELRKRDANLAAVKKKVEENPKLDKHVARLKNKYWWVYQIYCPSSLKDELPEEFIRGHYTQQARWQLKCPGNLISVEDGVLFALDEKKRVQERIDSLLIGLNDGRKQAYVTRTFNDLNDLFEQYNGENFDELLKQAEQVASLKKLDPGFLDKRKEIADFILKANEGIDGDVLLRYFQPNEKHRNRILRVEQESWDYLKNGKMPSTKEFFDMLWYFVDIEIPFFRRDEPKITWVGGEYCKGKEKKSDIHTVHDLDVDGLEVYGEKYKGLLGGKVGDVLKKIIPKAMVKLSDGSIFQIHKYPNEFELVTGVTENINEEDPDWMCAFNNRFDFIKMRETLAGFPVGDEASPPVFKVTTKFFERIGIRDRLIVDFLRWQKIAGGYEINAKLVTATGTDKDITYDEMEELEDESFGGDKKAGKKIGKYLGHDVDGLVGLSKGKFRKNLEDCIWMAAEYGVGIERLLYSPNCINDAQERNYFTALGIYREEVPPHLRTKKMQGLKTRSKEVFKQQVVMKSIGQKGVKGLSKNVYKVYIPVGEFFKDIVAVKFPDVVKLHDYMGQHRDDKQRLFFLEQYAMAFSRWIIADYGFFVKEVRAFNKFLKDANHTDFEDVYHSFRKNLSQNALIHLNKGNLGIKSVEKYATPEVLKFLARYDLGYENFQKLVNQRSVVKRRGRNIIGNYGVFPDRTYFVPEKRRKHAVVIEDVLRERFDAINSFFEENNLTVVAKEGYYVYLTGNKKALQKKDAPVVLVDEIPKMYTADSAYYQKYGFYSHMKVKDEPDYHLTMFEMKFYKRMLENLLEGRNEWAVESFNTGLNWLINEDVVKEELVFLNKAKNRYFAYTKDSDRRDKKMFFVVDNEFVPEETEIKFDDHGYKYFDDIDRGKDIKVYIRDINSIRPNFAKYQKRFEKRGMAMLKPIMKLVDMDFFF